MALSLTDVDVGTIAGDGTGDTARVAFQAVNSNNVAIETADAANFKHDGSVDMTGQFRTDVGTFDSDVADGASAVAYSFDTQNTYSTAGAKLASWKNAGAEKVYIGKEGEIWYAPDGDTNRSALSISDDGNDPTINTPSFWLNLASGGSKRLRVGSTTIDVMPAGDTLKGIEISATSMHIKDYSADFTIKGHSRNTDEVRRTLTIQGGDQAPSAVTNLGGGNLAIKGGAGASASAGDADGGHIYLDGGQGYGTGDHGGIYFANTRGRVSFFAATPVAQQSGTGETTGFTAGAGTAVNDDSTFTGNVGSTAYRISDIVKALKNYGLLAA